MNSYFIKICFLFFSLSLFSQNENFKVIERFVFSDEHSIVVIGMDGITNNEPGIFLFINENSNNDKRYTNTLPFTEITDLTLLKETTNYVLFKYYDHPTGLIRLVLIKKEDYCIYVTKFYDFSYNFDLDIRKYAWDSLTISVCHDDIN